MAPVALDKDDVSADVIAREKDIAMELARNEGKPEEMVEKIAIGRVNKFLIENTLMNQEFIKDNKKTVKVYLESLQKGMTVTAFRRVALSS
jgi:elongation factor Ts